MSTEHMHVTNSRVFEKKKVAHDCVQLNTEWNEKRVNVNVSNLDTTTGDFFASNYVTHCKVNVFLFPFVFGFREGTVSAGNGITVLLYEF